MDQLYKKIAALRDEFTEETGTKVNNSQGEPDIDYVDWLERRIVTPDSKDILGQETYGDVYDKQQSEKYLGEVPPQSNSKAVIMPTEEELKDACAEYFLYKPSEQNNTFVAWREGAKYALSQLKSVNLKDELVKFLRHREYPGNSAPDIMVEKIVDDYLGKEEK